MGVAKTQTLVFAGGRRLILRFDRRRACSPAKPAIFFVTNVPYTEYIICSCCSTRTRKDARLANFKGLLQVFYFSPQREVGLGR